jgi:hypothetical protein
VRPAVGVVGRDAEIQTDHRRRQAGRRWRGREVLLVSGEAGLGKTTLVAEAARAAFDAGACVLFGHCEEDLATPYQLFAEALGHYVTHAPEEQLLAHVEAHGSELSRLVPALASRIPRPATVEGHRLRHRAVPALRRRGGSAVHDVPGPARRPRPRRPPVGRQGQPAAAPPPGRGRTSHAGAHPRDLPRQRVVADPPPHRTLAALHRQRGVSRIELAGLDDSGVVALLEAAAGQTLDAAGVGLAHAVYRETDGNPFFVSEVLRHLSETGAIYQDATGRWVARDSLEQMALPDSVREVIGARVGRLGKDAGRVLSVASVIGRDFDLDLLARATKTSEDDLLDILDAAASVALVREVADTGRYSFAHALIQHTLYEDLGPQPPSSGPPAGGRSPGGPLRGSTGRGWANWPGTGRCHPPIDLAKAIDYSRQAGDAALECPRPRRRPALLRPGPRPLPPGRRPRSGAGIDLAIGLGTAQRQTGDPAFRATLLTRLDRPSISMTPKRLVAAALANDRGYVSNNNATDTDKVDVLEMASIASPADDPDRALVLATLCSELSYGSPLERRKALADEAMVIAASSGDDATIARVVNQVFYPLLVPSMLEQQLTRTEDAMVRAERVGDPVLLFLWRTHEQRPFSWLGTSTRWIVASRPCVPWPSSSISRY